MSELAKQFECEVLNFDRRKEIDKICGAMRSIMRSKLNKRGIVVAVSGGIDSSVSAALCVKAFGPNKVMLLQLPESESASETQDRSDLLVGHLKAPSIKQNIEGTLRAIGCYEARDQACASVFEDYESGWKSKIVIRGAKYGQFNHFMLVAQDPAGKIREKRLNIKEYLEIVAATNYKQRIRKTLEYYHADRLNYAVAGTPNRLEYDQGFFVKNGDGSADIKPIAHLYKSQVYALAEALGLPENICDAEPTTDTYSLPQGQDEFYFALDYKNMDKALWAYNAGAPPSETADLLSLEVATTEFIYRDIKAKRSTTRYLHYKPFLIQPVGEISEQM
jgi:NAD+ synthase